MGHLLLISLGFMAMTAEAAPRRAPECGVERYREKLDVLCGAKSHIEKRDKFCGVESYKQKADGDICGRDMGFSIALRKKGRSAEKCRWGSGSHIVYINKGRRHGNACYHSRSDALSALGYTKTCGYDIFTKDCAKPGVRTWGSYMYNPRVCRHENFGVEQYKECAHPFFGVKEYKTCRKPEFGVELFKECEIRKTKPELEGYIEGVKATLPFFSNLYLTRLNILGMALNNKRYTACTIAQYEDFPEFFPIVEDLKNNFIITFNEVYSRPEEDSCASLDGTIPVLSHDGLACSELSISSIPAKLTASQTGAEKNFYEACLVKKGFKSVEDWMLFHHKEIGLLQDDVTARIHENLRDQLNDLKAKINKVIKTADKKEDK